LRARARKIVQEEQLHFMHAEGWVRRLAQTQGAVRNVLGQALAKQWDEVLCWFGPPGDPAMQQLAVEGVIDAQPDVLRKRYLAKILPVLGSVGIELPATQPLHWTHWHADSRRLEVAAPRNDHAPPAPACPYCGSTEIEPLSLFGQQLLTVQLYCRACHTPFEFVKDDDVPHTFATKGNRPMTAASDTRTLVNYTTSEGIGIIELTNPPANTYSYEMMSQLDAAILQARFDEAVHVILIRGAGEKFFSAGAEISMLNSVSPTFKYYFCLHANETLNRLEQTPKLVIAAMNGHTVGGGLEIALACDIRIARRGAGKVGLPEVGLGVLPGTGGTQRLARALPKNKAIELMAEAKLLSFEDALDLGLINYLYDSDTYWDQVMAYARSFTPPNKASRAVGRLKRSVQSGAEIAFSEALALERELQQLCFQSEDAKEGIAAYTEKRQPSFNGR
jgi:enoyl-CoA hydratase